MSQRLRITGGKHVRQRFAIPASGVRPTTDRARETLFAILSSDLQKARVLDLFAGSGALGLEALSRGASEAYFVEKNPKVAQVLSRNISQLNLKSQSTLHKMDSWVYLKNNPDEAFDFIFMDPPYSLPLPEKWSQAVLKRLRPGGALILERDSHSPLEDHWGAHFEVKREKRFGASRILLLAAKLV
jgi:16S rRNA (guanine966-N2)-methyltransferase